MIVELVIVDDCVPVTVPEREEVIVPEGVAETEEVTGPESVPLAVLDGIEEITVSEGTGTVEFPEPTQMVMPVKRLEQLVESIVGFKV